MGVWVRLLRKVLMKKIKTKSVNFPMVPRWWWRWWRWQWWWWCLPIALIEIRDKFWYGMMMEIGNSCVQYLSGRVFVYQTTTTSPLPNGKFIIVQSFRCIFPIWTQTINKNVYVFGRRQFLCFLLCFMLFEDRNLMIRICLLICCLWRSRAPHVFSLFHCVFGSIVSFQHRRAFSTQHLAKINSRKIEVYMTIVYNLKEKALARTHARTQSPHKVMILWYPNHDMVFHGKHPMIDLTRIGNTDTHTYIYHSHM